MPSASVKVWTDALSTLPTNRMFSKLMAAIDSAAGGRLWDVDFSKGGGLAPKFYVVAEPAEFAVAYLRVAAQQRHAYEVPRGSALLPPFL